MDELILKAEPRAVVGKQVRALRRNGQVPGVVYGPGLAADGTVQVAVERMELQRFYREHGQSTLFSLAVGGGQHAVFIRDVQIDPVKHLPIHVDFYAPNLRRDMTAQVPIVLNVHLARHEGVLTQTRTEVELRGLPSAMPNQIEVDASGLNAAGDTIRVGDLPLPPGVVAVTNADDVVALIQGERGAAAADAAEAPAESPEPTAEASEAQS